MAIRIFLTLFLINILAFMNPVFCKATGVFLDTKEDRDQAIDEINRELQREWSKQSSDIKIPTETNPVVMSYTYNFSGKSWITNSSKNENTDNEIKKIIQLELSRGSLASTNGLSKDHIVFSSLFSKDKVYTSMWDNGSDRLKPKDHISSFSKKLSHELAFSTKENEQRAIKELNDKLLHTWSKQSKKIISATRRQPVVVRYIRIFGNELMTIITSSSRDSGADKAAMSVIQRVSFKSHPSTSDSPLSSIFIGNKVFTDVSAEPTEK